MLGLVSLLLGQAGAPILLAQGGATLQGILLAPSGRPAEGLRAVIEDLDTRQEYLSTPSDANGEYVVEVPVGASYRIVAAITPDGRRLPVRTPNPIPVRVPGAYRLPDVLFQDQAAEPTPKPEPATPTEPRPAPRPTTPTEPVPPAPSPTTATPVPKPWYARPGGIVGIVLGSVSVIAFSSGGGGGDGSPSTPLDD